MTKWENVRRRFWVESALAAATGILAIVTLFSPEWIEAVFGVDPDHGSGSLEWAMVAVLFVVTVGFSALARLEWRSPQPAEA